ncbi:MAG: hypothetical protein MUE66_09820 [Acidimicrobiia bacterium]|jgi:hypothetical protein|nr:hypothetical protein [Acidimicrobiia bacterium]
MRRLIPLLMLLALIATACRIESNLIADINADGSGVIGAEIGYDEEAEAFIEQFTQGEDPFADSPMAGMPGAQTREEDRGGMHFLISTAEVEDIAAAIEQSIAADPNSLLQEFSITVNANRVEVTGRGSLTGALEGAEGMLSPDQLAESVGANIRLTLPGAVLESNATSRDGNTLVWALPITGGDIEIRAASDPTQSPGGGFPLWAIIVIAAAAAAAVGAAVLMSRKRGGVAAPPTPPTPAMPAA